MTRFSPPIELIQYDRDKLGSGYEVKEYEFEGIYPDRARLHSRCNVLDDGWVEYLGKPCSVYIHNTHAHVGEPMYDRLNMMVIREHVLYCIYELYDEGVIKDFNQK